MGPLETLMRLLLNDPDPNTRAHARNRIAMGFDAGQSQPPPAPTPAPRFQPLGRVWLDRVNTCPYRECRTGCQRSLCHAGRGDSWGQVTLDDCRKCLRTTDLSKETQ